MNRFTLVIFNLQIHRNDYYIKDKLSIIKFFVNNDGLISEFYIFIVIVCMYLLQKYFIIQKNKTVQISKKKSHPKFLLPGDNYYYFPFFHAFP